MGITITKDDKGSLAAAGGEHRPSLVRQKPLFGGDFAPPEEKPVTPARPKPGQKSLFEVRKFSRSDFRAQGLKGFDNVNIWLTKVQPFVEKGYVIEYGHEGGRNGWSKVVTINFPPSLFHDPQKRRKWHHAIRHQAILELTSRGVGFIIARDEIGENRQIRAHLAPTPRSSSLYLSTLNYVVSRGV